MRFKSAPYGVKYRKVRTAKRESIEKKTPRKMPRSAAIKGPLKDPSPYSKLRKHNVPRGVAGLFRRKKK